MKNESNILPRFLKNRKIKINLHQQKVKKTLKKKIIYWYIRERSPILYHVESPYHYDGEIRH
jgi:hypothetical protein